LKPILVLLTGNENGKEEKLKSNGINFQAETLTDLPVSDEQAQQTKGGAIQGLGNDLVLGGDGDDLLLGGAGLDVLIANTGADR
jgi:hypothetical protein